MSPIYVADVSDLKSCMSFVMIVLVKEVKLCLQEAKMLQTHS